MKNVLSKQEYKQCFMDEAIAMAREALSVGEVPVGCVIEYQNVVIGRGRNYTNATKNATKHAEYIAIEQAKEWRLSELDGSTDVTAQPYDIFRDSSLYVTCEPCIMCAGALRRTIYTLYMIIGGTRFASAHVPMILQFKQVWYGCSNQRFGGCESIYRILDDEYSDVSNSLVCSAYTEDNQNELRPVPFQSGFRTEECVELLKGFYRIENPTAPQPIKKDNRHPNSA
eukprot:CFRG3635T1